MKWFSVVGALALILAVSACDGADAPKEESGTWAGELADGTDRPLTSEDERRRERGRLSGEDGFNLLGGSKDGGGGGAALGVNSFLWRATLDTLSFMPISSADPFGGTVLTDWYEDPKTPGERFKVNAMITDTALRADAIKVTLFKQREEKGQWRDTEVNPSLPRQLEDTILTRAREIRISKQSEE